MIRELRFPGNSLVLPGIICLALLLGAVTTDGFFTSSNIESFLLNASIVGIVATGTSLLTISGNLLSLGMQQSAMLGGVLLAVSLAHRWPSGGGLALAIASVIAVSLVQAVLVAVGLNAIIATLGCGTVIYGLVSYSVQVNGGTVNFSASGLNWVNGSAAGIPVEILIFAAVTTAAGIIYHKHKIGRRITLAGSSRAAAQMSGVSVRSVILWTFAALGITAGVGGALGALTVDQATPTMLSTLTFDVAAAVLIGGVSVQGGEGSPVLAAIGAVLIAALDNVMLLHNFSSGAQQMTTGALLVLTVIVMRSVRRQAA